MNKPPRFVPTLTEIVPDSSNPETAIGVEAGKASDAKGLQHELVRRILQRVDMTLERQLREAVGALILEQTRNLVPLLREQIENTVRESVSVAVAIETGRVGNR
jgi:hypothetical protein